MSSRSKNQTPGKVSITVAVLYLMIIGASALLGKVPRFILWYYLACSVVTFLVYAKDKSAAKKGAWRTPEQTLHIMSLVGGWPGALVAQQTLRHKSQKVSFRIVLWITVIINAGAFVWLHTHNGQVKLQTIINWF